ncbi:PQQ-dependent sugar dehydrogenase [Halomonas huangheensis]|uniref:Glucose/Sorbosone dehydrogenase domain-containing protein n=2 Tax=Halomonas huangheensis TaxID=1178482 RepID=W1N8J9_9GAMM|nr:PQQ-dependent sugar dehydrogenase [Halomonas huangheensis]ERL51897.1 hypothetical protein BJB45_12075 [Halomonas huangheensis]
MRLVLSLQVRSLQVRSLRTTMTLIGIVTLGLSSMACAANEEADSEETVLSEDYRLSIETIEDGLSHPWSLAFLPDERMLISERGGRLLLLDSGQPDSAQSDSLQPDSVQLRPLAGMPQVSARGQGGLFDIALHPNFGDGEHDWLYFSWARPGSDSNRDATALSRIWFDGQQLGRIEHLFIHNRPADSSRHYGGRLLWLSDSTLLMSIGERGERDRAQHTQDHAGSLVRLDEDGNLLPAAVTGAADGIHSMGHRNPQGLAMAADGTLWSTEHGPRTGDELNLITAGANYGWPEVSLGREYVSFLPVGDSSAPGMQDPAHVFEGRFAPSGLAVVASPLFPAWQGDLLAGGLSSEQLVRLDIDAQRVKGQEVLIDGQVGRIRDVRQGPDGAIYLLTDEDPGKLLRLFPSDI